VSAGFVPPPYPYERLDRFKAAADAHSGGLVDLSIGTPTDPPPAVLLDALAHSNAERGYPPSVGSAALKDSARAWMKRKFDVDLAASQLAACVGTKEFVGTLPQWLRLRTPDRDTVLYPAVSYPTYEMGATLAGGRAVPVPVDDEWRLRLDAIDEADAARALCLWVNSPGNPAGGLDDLGAAAAWGRAHGVPIFSDECYVEFTWSAAGHTILEHGLDGVIAVHSLSKRSNAAGMRVGVYAGDEDLVYYLSEVRKHVGLMVPGPVQAAAAAAWADDDHVVVQRDRYLDRLRFFAEVLDDVGARAPMPGGGFYLWARAPGDDAWAFTQWLAETGGVLVSPGDLYGAAGAAYVRVALVAPVERLELVARRLKGQVFQP
jgi:succinyldiaminopimelate transaminase